MAVVAACVCVRMHKRTSVGAGPSRSASVWGVTRRRRRWLTGFPSSSTTSTQPTPDLFGGFVEGGYEGVRCHHQGGSMTRKHQNLARTCGCRRRSARPTPPRASATAPPRRPPPRRPRLSGWGTPASLATGWATRSGGGRRRASGRGGRWGSARAWKRRRPRRASPVSGAAPWGAAWPSPPPAGSGRWRSGRRRAADLSYYRPRPPRPRGGARR